MDTHGKRAAAIALLVAGVLVATLTLVVRDASGAQLRLAPLFLAVALTGAGGILLRRRTGR